MNATELAAEFGRMAAQAESTRKRTQLLSGYEASALEAEANAFRIAQELVTKHLCTTNPVQAVPVLTNCHIRSRSDAGLDLTSGALSLDRYAIVPLERLPAGFWDHVDGKKTPTPLHDAAPGMLAALEEVVVWFDSLPAGHMDNKWPDGLYDTVLTATARAKGTPDV